MQQGDTSDDINPLRLAIEEMIAKKGVNHQAIAKMIGCATDTLFRLKRDGYAQTLHPDTRRGIERTFGKDVADWFRKRRRTR